MKIQVEMRRGGLTNGVGQKLSPGDVIATIELADGIDLNYLVDAVRMGVASRVKSVDFEKKKPAKKNKLADVKPAKSPGVPKVPMVEGAA